MSHYHDYLKKYIFCFFLLYESVRWENTLLCYIIIYIFHNHFNIKGAPTISNKNIQPKLNCFGLSLVLSYSYITANLYCICLSAWSCLKKDSRKEKELLCVQECMPVFIETSDITINKNYFFGHTVQIWNIFFCLSLALSFLSVYMIIWKKLSYHVSVRLY